LFKVSSWKGIIIRRTVCLIAVVQIIYCITGCSSSVRSGSRRDLGTTIGSLVEVIYPESISVEGFGLVGGLRGTGSMECPPQIRSYLTQYIMAQLPADTMSKAETLINSLDTAVVMVEAVIPVQDAKSKYFDVRVSALPGTQTTSLDGGWLYRTELKVTGSFGITTEVLADAEGPVFTDKISASSVNKRAGYILAGGKTLAEYDIILVLEKPDFKLSNVIRNRLNERFGRDVAVAVSPGRIQLRMPVIYKEHRKRFLSIVRAMYLEETPEMIMERIRYYAEELARAPERDKSEFALEAIGNQSLVELSALLISSDERVRLRAARCMLNLGSNAGLQTLRQIAMDSNSNYRIEALESITTAARPQEAASVARMLLRDRDFKIRLKAYEQLRKLDDAAVNREAINQDFYLEQVVRTEHKMIYAFRSGQPRIVLFGAPIYCNRGIFIQSPDGEITINAPVNQGTVSLIRTHPKRPSVIAQMTSSFELSDIIRKLCTEPATKGENGRGGLGVPYADMIALLKQLCDKGAVDAEFRAGPMPKIVINIKK
jgi:hypothetical protein